MGLRPYKEAKPACVGQESNPGQLLEGSYRYTPAARKKRNTRSIQQNARVKIENEFSKDMIVPSIRWASRRHTKRQKQKLRRRSQTRSTEEAAMLRQLYHRRWKKQNTRSLQTKCSALKRK
ncbi:hypothetical protein TNCT_167081 [Trichonephila clavata]|uniref:Uncharacterized protein n=1 Tax=Trichonephila clavata TaxID=2740835 RepID=A0A8X6LL59_TRICU|nr:hypothetical protein TNCT_167081 [Trichonephila clavata]